MSSGSDSANDRSSGTDASGTDEGPAARLLAGQGGLKAWQEDLYRGLHEHPELSDQESKTAATAATVLRDAGFEVHEGIGTTGLVGVLRNGEGPTVLVRADMDGLPMREETGLPYASTDQATDSNGAVVPVAHACGHDVHVASLLAAARLFAAERSAWRGTFIALFQPAEETGAGAQEMVDDGLATSIPKPDVALAQHVLAYPSGSVGIVAGPFLSTAASMRITLHGRGAHGSMPHLAKDPVVLAAMIVVGLQAIVAREIDPSAFAVLTVGRLAAGTKSNIIPDEAVIELNIRAYDDGTRLQLIDAIKRVVIGECAAAGTPKDPDFELYGEYPLTANDPAATARVKAAFEAHFGDAVMSIPRQTASEDFSAIPAAFGIPYTYWALGGTDPEAWHRADAAGTLTESIPANHSPKFAPVLEPTLETGTAAIVVASLAWLAAS